MAGYCEPMDIDDVPVDFDDKENVFRHKKTGTALHSLSEKMSEDLDVSEINMKLRLSCTPLVSSAIEKHFTGSAKKLFPESEEADISNVTVMDSGDITMAAWSMNNCNSSNSTSEPDSNHSYNETAVLHSTTPPEEHFNNVMTMLDTTKNEGDLSYLQTHDPKPASPIMRGLKSVLSMFRPSQSPIASSNDIKLDIQDDRTPDISINSVEVSTPVPNNTRKKQKGSQSALKIISSDSTNSIVFSEDLINDLKWNDDSTIIFNTEKMPDIQSDSSLNSKGSMPSVDSNSESDEKLSVEIEEREDSINAVILETEVENMDMSMNHSNLKFPSQFQQSGNEKQFSNKEMVELNETYNSVPESVIEQAQEIIYGSFTKGRCKQHIKSDVNTTTMLGDHVSGEHLEIISQHTEDNTINAVRVRTENHISEKDESSSDLIVNPNELHAVYEIKRSFDEKNTISCQLVTNFSEQDSKDTYNSNINISKASNATCVTYDVNSSAGQTTILMDDENVIEPCVVPVELCNNEENIQKQFAQATEGGNIGNEIVSSENTSPFISLNAADENIEFGSADNHKKMVYDSIENPFATVLKIKMTSPRNDPNLVEIKNPFTMIATTSKSPPRDVRRIETPDVSTKIEINQEIKAAVIEKKPESNCADQTKIIGSSLRSCESDTYDILHTAINNDAIDFYLKGLSLQESENLTNALASVSNAAPRGSDILYEDNSDAYLSADSGRESEQLLENEMEQIDKEREAITPTPNIENLDENRTICLSPNYGKTLPTTGGDIQNYVATKNKTSMSPCGIPNNSVHDNNEVYIDAENALEEINYVISRGSNRETRNTCPEKLSTVKSNKEQVFEDSPSTKLKQEREKKDQTNSDGKQYIATNLQHNKYTVPNYKDIGDGSELDISHIEKGDTDSENQSQRDFKSTKNTSGTELNIVNEVDDDIKSNAIKNEAKISKTIFNIDKMPDLEKEKHISALDTILEPNLVENPFATKSRLSVSPLRSVKNGDDSFEIRSKEEISLSTTPVLPITRTDKDIDILDPFTTKSKLRMSPCQNEISEKHATINDATVSGESQETIHNLVSDKNKNVDNKINLIKNSPQANVSISPESSPEANVTIREVHTEDEDTMEGPQFEEALDSSFESTTKVKSSPPKDHNKSEIKPLQVIMCDDIASAGAAMVELPTEEEFMEFQDEEFRPGELFINADTFEFLMSQGTAQNTDYGKESLFLKFDPLCARRSSAGTKDVDVKLNKTVLHQPEVIIEESPIAQIVTPVKYKTQCNTTKRTPENSNTVRDKTSTPENLNNTRDLDITPKYPNTADVTSSSENFNTTTDVTSAPEFLNTTRDVTKSTVEILDTTVCVPTSMINTCSNEKPTMAVPPSTVNNDMSTLAPSPTYTPTRTERRSVTFSSPAIAAIDRLISLSGNNSPMTQTYYAENTSQETREAVFQIQDLLTVKEAEVNQLKHESKELQDKLVDLDIQMKILKEDNEERLRKIEELKVKLTHKTAMNKNMSAAVAEYERVVASMIAENEEERLKYESEKASLIRERDEQISHLNSMEGSFSDLHTKYERTKQLILTFKANEEILRRSINEYKVQTEKLEHNYESLKHQAITQLNNANVELEKLKRSHEAEVLKLNTQMRRKELHVASLEESLAQKIKANEELTAICDEIISKVG